MLYLYYITYKQNLILASCFKNLTEREFCWLVTNITYLWTLNLVVQKYAAGAPESTKWTI